ncbi:putative serine esterase-domain-containing protein [Pisolithus thermaeus]|nr:putative serine esterase-domain-containing protein [Pisolithus croceorrhizus]KAI6164627.1 putative serine esterase-domain-containing protein [Pisolithus thermaeus]
MASVHLLVLIHGMWGNPSHLTRVHEIIQEVKGNARGDGSEGTELAVLVAQTNRDESTYDGIDWGGERVAKEVINEVHKYESQGRRVTRFSIMGYSLGGLLGRYVIGILHQQKFFDKVTPVNFNTISTPHVGIPTLPTALSAVSSYLGRKLLSRTGEQFFCADKWSPKGRPLIEVLSDPDHIFYQALLLFPNIRIYANAINDLTVPYVTGAIESTDPFHDYRINGINIEFLEDYKFIIKSYTQPNSTTSSALVARRPLVSRITDSLPPIPPALRFTFPYNIMIFPFLPVLLPTFVSILLVRFSISSKKSRARLQSLEADASAGERLAHVVARLERELEAAALDVYEDPRGLASADPSPDSSEVAKLGSGAELVPQSESASLSRPTFTTSQLRSIDNLNKIPQLKKTLAFFEDVFNSHAIIICRLSKYEHNWKGECVLRHWADQFEL